MLGVRRYEDVPADVDTGARAFLQRDDGQAVEKVIQHLLTFGGRLLRDAVANL